ncbi:DNA repair protein RadC [Myroides ceti]|uniref:DNA repair protein RadC n=1 Tax=Paenimyroides ceti TaxID=395087 RepID=A0ABT8CN34_9FLAO|nr:DNA repair protein RadC [Paenimyroides ceti]MDN3705933.1 DNA repair protein RadC [Paenimyroides ceti]
MNKNKKFSIKNWSQEDQPREKLMSKGTSALSNAELMAILIRSGSENQSAVDLCKRILEANDQKINLLAQQDIRTLKQFKGIGEAKAIIIIAALELGKRRRFEEAKAIPRVSSSKSVFEIMQPLIGDLKHEEFWMLMLNNDQRIIGKSQLSSGGLTSTIVDVRILFKRALEAMATSIILVHNHPSGQLKPSASDKEITHKIKEAGKVLDIKLLDHIIVTQHDYLSFADENIIL